jgi:hypothetical protein
MSKQLDRLARAVHLDAARLATGVWRVSGGASAHEVSAGATTCDCADYGVRGGQCKHVLRVLLALGDPETLASLREIVTLPKRARARQAS